MWSLGLHCGFDINHGIPNKIFMTEGNGAERTFVPKILSKGQTGVMDRGYQSHKEFDLLQEQGKHFVCRIKARTTRTVIETHDINPDSHIFYDALVLLGTPNQNQTKNPVRVVGYEISKVKYYVATDRRKLTAEQIATIYKLRWSVDIFQSYCLHKFQIKFQILIHLNNPFLPKTHIIPNPQNIQNLSLFQIKIIHLLQLNWF